MAGFRDQLVGSLTAVYTAAEQTANGLRAGMIAYDQQRRATFIFLINSGSAAITEKLVAVALGTDKTNYYCALAAATAGVIGFAGVRISGADSMPQNSAGWFQITGMATLTASSDTTTADTPVVTSNQSAGQVEAMANTGLGAAAAIGDAVTTTASGDVVVALNKNVWGVGC